jgi:site-specific recombinase XerD
MEIDKDIQQLLTIIEAATHPIELGIQYFIESLPGYNNRLHCAGTVSKYDACLRKAPHCFLIFMHSKGIHQIEHIKKEDAELFKGYLLNHLDPQTVRSYMTAARLFFQFILRLGWLKEDYSVGMRQPKPQRKGHIKIISNEIVKEVLDGEWGKNSFVVARNHLIACLFLRRGLHPKEFRTILEEHVHPYEDLAYVTVFGKRNEPRDVMLDPETLEAWRIYMVERAHFMYEKKIHTKHIFLSINPHDDSYAITTPGVQAIIRRIKHELKMNGCMWDLSVLNAQGCRRTAVSHDYEIAEDSPIHHPELTLSGQYGHSLEIAQKHYWRKSLKNAYRFIKGGYQPSHPSTPPSRTTPSLPSQSPPSSPGNDIKGIFPESSFFRDFGVGI